VLRPGYLPADDLPALYSGATLLTFVSHDEGFGLPALEAMACGTPVVVADRGALPEITGDAALRADPEDPESIAAAIGRITRDAEVRERLRKRGLERARQFSWKKTADEMIAVYRELVPDA
jgi:glycosyltransferase involved in cell wall biosynthesis